MRRSQEVFADYEVQSYMSQEVRSEQHLNMAGYSADRSKVMEVSHLDFMQSDRGPHALLCRVRTWSML